MDIWQTLLAQWQAQSLWELAAVALSVGYIFFAARASIWCWPCAFLSTGIFSVLFFDVNLLQEAALNVYYLIIALYGWWAWRKGGVTDSGKDTELPISSWGWHKQIPFIAITLIVGLLSGYFSKHYLNADMPYLNGLSSWFAVFSTYLVARKVIENWIYWMLINPVSMYMFFQKELYVTCLLMLLYFVMSIYGLLEWRRQWLAQDHEQRLVTTSR